jgi:hypothetical protein
MKRPCLGIRLLMGLSFLVSAVTPGVRAQTLSSSSVVNGQAQLGGVNGVVDEAQLGYQSSSTNPGAKTTCSGSYSVLGTTGSATAQAIATYGILRADSTATSQAAPGGPGALANGSAAAAFTDYLTFTGLTQPATLDATFTLSGSLTSDDFGTSSVNFTTEFEGLSPCVLVAAGQCMISASVNDSSALILYADLTTVAAVSSDVIGGGSASANFLDTAIVDSLILVDANGNPISGADIITASGTNYNSLTAPTPGVPEPSSLMMLGVGLIGLLRLGLKRSL